jgi:hypothetical protein
MTVQENHDLADGLLLGPGGRDAASSYWTAIRLVASSSAAWK